MVVEILGLLGGISIVAMIVVSIVQRQAFCQQLRRRQTLPVEEYVHTHFPAERSDEIQLVTDFIEVLAKYQQVQISQILPTDRLCEFDYFDDEGPVRGRIAAKVPRQIWRRLPWWNNRTTIAMAIEDLLREARAVQSFHSREQPADPDFRNWPGPPDESAS